MKSKSTFSILFFLRQERENKNGAPLMLRVTINGKSAKTSLGIRVPSKDWDGERGNRTLGDFVFYRCHEFLVLLSKPYKHRA